MSAALELTGAQRGILDAVLLWPDSPAFVLAEYLELRGDLDAGMWAAAIRLMVVETEAQRIMVRDSEDGPRQHIAEPDEVPVTLLDLSDASDPHAEAHRLMRADYCAAVDPGGVTTRHLVLRVSGDQVLWYHRAHHIALDGYGFALCARRVAGHYLGLTTGDAAGARKLESAAVVRTLAEVVAEDVGYRTSPQHGLDRDYWHTLLTAPIAPTLTDRPRLPAAHRLRVRRDLTCWTPQTRVRFGAAELILTAVAVHLSRWTGAAEVVLGVPMMNRFGSAAATVPAMVLNAIAVPVRSTPDDTITGIAESIGATLRTGRKHARYRHETLRRELGRIGGNRRLFGPVVNIMPFDYPLDLPGIDIRAHNLTAGPVEDLSVNVYLRSGTAELCLDANPGSYTNTELNQHADAIATLIARAAANPSATVHAITRRVEPLQSPDPHPAPNPAHRIKTHAAADTDALALLDAKLCPDGNSGSGTSTELEGNADATGGLIARAAADPSVTVRAIGRRVGPVQSPDPHSAPNPMHRIKAHAEPDPDALALLGAGFCPCGNSGSGTSAELDGHADATGGLIGRAAGEPAVDPAATVAAIARRVVPVQSPDPQPAPNPVHRIQSHAAAGPSALALLDADTGRGFGRAELLRAAAVHAQRLRAAGVGPGDLVALLPSCRFDDLILILGIHLAGAGHVALDGTSTTAELQAVLTELDPDVLVYNSAATTFAREIVDSTPVRMCCTDSPTVQDHSRTLDEVDAEPEHTGDEDAAPCGARRDEALARDDKRPGARASDPVDAPQPRVAYVVFTSGSTGRPKGVAVGDEAFAAFVDDAVHRYGWGPGDRVLQFGPLHADTSIEELFVALAAGACVVTTSAGQRFSVPRLVEAAHRGAASVLDLPTAVWHELATAVCGGAVVLPETLRHIIIGGEQASPELTARWQRHSAITLINSYGPSEATVVCAAGPVLAEHDAAQPVPLGRLFPRVGAALLVDDADPAYRPDVAGARVGELCLYGPTLADGYLPDPGDGPGFGPLRLGDRNVRAFHTGDLVRVHANGTVDFLGRIDDLVKIGGRRVHTATIEDALRRIPGITAAMVHRSGPLALAALVTTDGPADTKWLDRVRSSLSDDLPPSWIPARITAVDTLPTNRNLKLERRASAPPVYDSATASPDAASAPTSRINQVLTIFREVVGDPDLAPDADFFGNGGTSMQTIAIANRLTLALGTPVPIEDVFAHPTAAELAAQYANPTAPSPAHAGVAIRQHTAAPDLAAEVATLLVNLHCANTTASAATTHVAATTSVAAASDVAAASGVAAAIGVGAATGVASTTGVAGTASVVATATAGVTATPVPPGGQLRVLLTGATGFFGPYLLDALLRDTAHEILAIVRADSDAAAHARVRAATAGTDAADMVARALASGRLVAIQGDCAAPGLALNRQVLSGVGHIVHSAATISPVRTYTGLRASNVVSTAELLRLASATGAGVTLVSTVTASGPHGALGVPDQLPTGYAQSKCIAEHLVTAAARESGLRTAIARLGRVLPAPGDTRAGRRDFLVSVADAVRAVGAIPAITLREPMVRADMAAQIVAGTLNDPGIGTRILDVVGNRPLSVREVLTAAHDLPEITLREWREQICAATALDADVRHAVLAWCDIQLAGFDRDWSSEYAIALPDLSAIEAAQLLGIASTEGMS